MLSSSPSSQRNLFHLQCFQIDQCTQNKHQERINTLLTHWQRKLPFHLCLLCRSISKKATLVWSLPVHTDKLLTLVIRSRLSTLPPDCCGRPARSLVILFLYFLPQEKILIGVFISFLTTDCLTHMFGWQKDELFSLRRAREICEHTRREERSWSSVEMDICRAAGEHMGRRDSES